MAQNLLLQKVNNNSTQRRALRTNPKSARNVVKNQRETFQDQIAVDREDLSTDSSEKPVPTGTGFVFCRRLHILQGLAGF